MTSDDLKHIKVQVLFFGGARDAARTASLDISLANPATVGTAFATLVEQFPDLARFGRSLLFAVNQEYQTTAFSLRENDELAIFPPVSGG